MASAAIPGVFAPVRWDGRDLVDGGVSNNTPITHALDLAADEASLWGRPLRVVYAYRPGGTWASPTRPTPPVSAEPEAVLAWVRERLQAHQPCVPWTYRAAEGDAVTVLVGESREAALTVVGHRGIGGYAGLAAGSVSQQLVTRCQSTVIVARGATAAHGAPIVVGVDAAVPHMHTGPAAYALAEAALRRVRVEAVYAWTPVGDRDSPPDANQATGAKRAAEALAAALEAVVRAPADVGLKSIVETTTDPAAALVAATSGAGLVVIGPHQGAPLRQLQPGSVGAALLRRSACPLAVVRRLAVG
jgi:nucleotide-binding universal stress UspA family protein